MNVSLGAVPSKWPDGSFDLIVLSELLYYFDAEQLIETRERVDASTEPGSLLVLVHYRRPVPEHTISGDMANDLVAGNPRWSPRGSYVDDDFRLDLAVRADD